jgi:hypothetical protein
VAAVSQKPVMLVLDRVLLLPGEPGAWPWLLGQSEATNRMPAWAQHLQRQREALERGKQNLSTPRVRDRHHGEFAVPMATVAVSLPAPPSAQWEAALADARSEVHFGLLF